MIKTKNFNTNKKIFAIMLLIITLFSNIQPVLAISGSGSENFVGGQFATYIHTTDNANTQYGILARRLIRMNDTSQRFTVFCVEHGVDFDTGVISRGDYYVPTNETIKRACKVAYLGWYSKYGDYVVDGGINAESMVSRKKDYVFTQQMIWETLGQSSARFVDSTLQNEFVAFKNNINNQIANMEKRPSFDATTITVDAGKSKTITDSNGVLSQYNSVDRTVDGIRIQHTKGQNTMTITVDENCTTENYRLSDATMKSWGFIKDETKETDTNIYFEFTNGQQKQMMAMSYNDPVSMAFSLKINVYGEIELAKKDNKGNYVPNTTFKVSYNSDMSNPIGTYTTGSNGKVKVEKVRPGTVYIQETSVPKHLILDNSVKSVTVQPSKTAPYQATNNWKQGYIQVAKKDKKTGQVVEKAGTEFEILKDSSVVATITTQNSGVAKSGLLDYGEYTVREKKAPQNYIITNITANTNITENEKIYVVEISNDPVLGQINLSKNDKETGKKAQGHATLVGARYSLIANENILNPSDATILFNKDEVISRKTVGSGTWGDTGTKTVDSNFNITWSNLPMGNYRIEEIQAPTGYLLDNSHSITLSSTSSSKALEIRDVTSNEQVKKGYIQVVKKDIDTGKIVKKAGAEFEILFEGKVVSTIITNANGVAKSGLLAYGTYTVREKLAPYKYTKTDVTKTIDVHENNKTYEIEFKNKRVVGTVNISKVDTITGKQAQGEATLQGAVYGLYARTPILDPADDSIIYNTNEKVGELITDKNANATLNNLYLGEYYIKEIKPSVGYNLDTTVYNFDLVYENQNVSVITRDLTVKERVISQAFEIIKISSDGVGEAEILEGVEFTIKAQKDIDKYGSWEKAPIAKNANNETAAILVTDSKGNATSERLPYGTYVVRETKVPDDKYKVADFKVVVSKDSSEPQTWRVFNDTSFMSILAIVKQDAETGKIVKVEGATFKIKNTDTNEYFGYWDWSPLPHYVDSWKTDETGTVMTGEQLKVGNYQLEELKSPKGYLVSSNPISFRITTRTAYETLPDGQTVVITIKQNDTSVKGKVNVEKRGEVLTDFVDGKFIYEERGLANAKYEIFARENIMDPSGDGTVIYKKGTVVDTITTNSEGKATTEELPLGEYSVREIKAPEGMVINNEVKDVSLIYKDQNTAIVYDKASFVNERQKVDINVIKKDADEDIGLLGAEFGIYAKTDILNYNGEIVVRKGDLIETATSNTEGKLHFTSDFPLTEFEIKEIKAPIGYSSNNQVINVDATYQGQEISTIHLEYEFKNKIIKVEVSKQDITNSEEIEGAHLIVFEKDNEGAIFDTWVSGEDGKNEDGTIKPHLIKGMEVGKTYVLRETSSPYGFALTQDVEFTIQDTGDIQSVVMKDELVYGELEFNKLGEIFNQTITEQTEFGEAQSPVWNESNLLGSEITIYANEDIKIGNTTYYKKDEKIQTLESDWENVRSEKLPVGSYYYVESKVPHGYIADTNRHYFQVEDNQKNELQVISSTLVNNRPKFNIDMIKILEEQKIFVNKDAYKDIVFGIYAREDIHDYMGNVAIEYDTMIATTGITEDGKLENIPDLPNGVYFIKELQTNSQYVLNDKEYDFEVAYHGKDISEYIIQIGVEGIVDNKLARGSIQVKKIDTLNDEVRLEGVEFNISSNKDMKDVITTSKTNADGIAIFENLELGTYYIQEAKQVDGYTLNDYIYKVEVTKDGDILVIECENQPTEMIFSKVDETGTNELPGATIQIIDKETGEIVEEWESTDEPHIIHYLVEGKEYIMKEITAPYGYEVAEEIIFVAGDGEKVTMKNMPILRSVQVEKLDKTTKEHIKSNKFVFGIYEDKECTKLIKQAGANEYEGTALFENLRFGTYYIKEIQAPLGYKLSEQVVKIEINEKGVFADGKSLEEKDNIYSFEYYNALLPTVQTGNEMNYPLLFSLMGLSLVGITTGVIILKRKNKKE